MKNYPVIVPVTRESVRRAAIELLADGRRPATHTIRARLGTGSNTTIAKYLTEFWQGILEVADPAGKHPDVPNQVATAMTSLWHEALVLSDGRYAQERQVWATEKQAMNELANSQAASLESKENTLKETQAERDQLLLEAATSKDITNRLTSEKNRLEQQTQMSDTRITDLTDNNNSLKAQIDTVTRQFSDAEQRHQSRDEKQEQLRQRLLDDHNKLAGEFRIKNEVQAEQIRAKQMVIDNMETSHSALLEKLRAQGDAHKIAIKAHQDDIATLQRTNENQRQECEALKSKLQEQQGTIANQKGQLEAITSEHEKFKILHHKTLEDHARELEKMADKRTDKAKRHSR